MKNFICAIALMLALTGCLLPKKVELGQHKVKAVPGMSDDHVEVLKETAEYATRRANDTVLASLRENASSNVINPAWDSYIASLSVSGSLGKPLNKWSGNSTNIAKKLDREDAKLDARVADYKEDIAKDVGKKIEGTGWLQMGYFTHLFLIVIIIVVLWVAIKVVGTVTGGPAVGIGMKVLSGGVGAVANLAKKGFSELVQAGETFKDDVAKKFSDPKLQQEIIDTFVNAHKKEQSKDVQSSIKQLIAK